MARFDLKKRTGYGALLKVIVWHPSAREIVRAFPEAVRVKVGYLLQLLQRGETLLMPQAKPMSNIASGVFELRARSRDGIFRIFYLSKTGDEIYVFHAFQKKTEKTPDDEISLGQKRLREILEK